MTKKTIVILGASDDQSRYSYKAFQMLKHYGHRVTLVNPHLKSIDGQNVIPRLTDIVERPHTLTVYVNPKISSTLLEDIIKLHPQRVIFNPGSENPDLKNALQQLEIEVVEDCTLIMLQSNKF